MRRMNEERAVESEPIQVEYTKTPNPPKKYKAVSTNAAWFICRLVQKTQKQVYKGNGYVRAI